MVISVALLAGLASCHDDNWSNVIDGGNEKGTLRTSSITVDVADAIENVTDKKGTKDSSRSVSRDSYDLSEYIITVTDKKTGNVVEEWSYSAMPELPTFPVGNYTITAKSHELEATAWEKPYFEGSADFEIKANEITDCTVVTCKFASVKVTVNFTQALLRASNNGADLKVVVESTAGNSLEFTAETVGKAGYFKAADQTLALHFTGTVGGYAEDFTRVVEDVVPGQYRKVTFGLTANDVDMPAETGNVEIGGVSVSSDVEDEDLTINNSYDEPNLGGNDRPGKEDPEDPEPPGPGDDTDCIDFKSENLNLEAPNTTADLAGKAAVVEIISEHGISSLMVTIESDGLTPEVLDEVQLTDQFDLAAPGSYKDAIKGLGLPVEEDVLGKNSVEFDITQFIPLLNIYPGKNVFKLNVTDSEGHSKMLVLTINS